MAVGTGDRELMVLYMGAQCSKELSSTLQKDLIRNKVIRMFKNDIHYMTITRVVRWHDYLVNHGVYVGFLRSLKAKPHAIVVVDEYGYPVTDTEVPYQTWECELTEEQFARFTDFVTECCEVA